MLLLLTEIIKKKNWVQKYIKVKQIFEKNDENITKLKVINI